MSLISLNFTKLQGAGNDFILVAGSDPRDWARLAMTICDRHYGVGGDGLLVLLPSDKADFQMRVFNPDGSEAETCGNGLRCFARYILDKRLASPKASQVLVETIAGTRTVRFVKKRGKASVIQVSMGSPRFHPKDIPVTIEPGGNLVDIMSTYPLTIEGIELRLSFVSMGNPHAVHFWQHPVANFPLLQLGPKVERHQIFPSRVNFEVARVLNRQEIEARVWERGVGETLSCGTGACAIAVAAQLHGYVDSRVGVKLPGGTLNVQWDGVGEVFLSGPAEIVFTGKWPKKE